MTARLMETAPGAETIKRWAAEHIAIELGLLRECPYHGEPYRTQRETAARSSYCAFATHDPLLAIFRGDAGELLAAVDTAAGQYACACPTCDRVRSEPE